MDSVADFFLLERSSTKMFNETRDFKNCIVWDNPSGEGFTSGDPSANGTRHKSHPPI